MLHVIIQQPFDEKAQCTHFEIGQSTAALNPDLVQSVVADGPELVEIIKNFEGVPKRYNRPQGSNADQRWYGDDAKFIVANWS